GYSFSASAFNSALNVFAASGETDPSALDAIFKTVDYNATGNSGPDKFEGGNLADTVDGGAGNDTFIGSGGADVANGHTGFDTVDYHTATAGLTADLSNPANNTGDAAGDTYISIENLAGTVFADKLVGDSGDNVLTGGPLGDVLDGGAGNDTASYLGSLALVTA